MSSSAYVVYAPISLFNDEGDNKTLGLSARCEVDVYLTESRPLVVGIEKTETVGERGNGSTGERNDWGSEGTGGGDCLSIS